MGRQADQWTERDPSFAEVAEPPPSSRLVAMSPEHSAAEPDLRSYLSVLRRRKWIVALTVLIAVGAALAYSFIQSPRYSATAEVLIQPSSPASTALGGSAAQVQLTPTDVQTELQLVSSAAVKQQVAATLHVTKAPPVSVTVAGQTNILDVSATASSPPLVAGIANAYARSYIGVRRDQIVSSLLAMATQIQDKIDGLQAQIARAPTAEASALATQVAAFQAQLSELQVNSSLANGGALLVTPATPPSGPSSPKPERSGIIALVVGLLAGIALAFLREHLDDTIKTREDLVALLPDLPTIATIPAVGNWKDRKVPHLVSVDRPNSAAAEAYRALRTSVQFMGLDRPLRVIQVTSPSAVEGKTTTLANLAVATAQAGQRVIIVCCDLRRPRVHEFFGLSNEDGFTSALLGQAPLSAVIQEVAGIEGLSVLPSGPLPSNPADLLASTRVREIVDVLRLQSDLVLLDCPPILPVTDAAVLAELVDGTLLVTSAGSTTRHALARAVDSLGQVNAPLLGITLNGTSDEELYGAGVGYRYGYTSSGTGERPTISHQGLRDGQLQ